MKVRNVQHWVDEKAGLHVVDALSPCPSGSRVVIARAASENPEEAEAMEAAARAALEAHDGSECND